MSYGMSTEDVRFTVEQNLRHKRWLSPDSVENTIMRRIEKTPKKNEHVRQSEENLQWILDVEMAVDTEIHNQAMIRLGNPDPDTGFAANDVAWEQSKLRILEEIGWVYQGTFHDPTHARAYPELSFTLTTRYQSGVVWYVVYYGILKGFEEPHHGTYSLFLTLDEVMEFLRDKALHVGQREYYKKVVRRVVAIEEKKMNRELTNEEKNEFIKMNQKELMRQTYRYTSDQRVQEVLHNLKSSSDVSTLHELIAYQALPLARQKVSEAKNHAETERRAQQLEDIDSQELDTTVSITASGSIEDAQGNRLNPIPERPRTDPNDDTIANILAVDDDPSEGGKDAQESAQSAVSAPDSAVVDKTPTLTPPVAQKRLGDLVAGLVDDHVEVDLDEQEQDQDNEETVNEDSDHDQDQDQLESPGDNSEDTEIKDNDSEDDTETVTVDDDEVEVDTPGTDEDPVTEDEDEFKEIIDKISKKIPELKDMSRFPVITEGFVDDPDVPGNGRR